MLNADEDLSGSVVQGHVVLERIGQGASATVYRAIDSENGNRMVALKVMHRGVRTRMLQDLHNMKILTNALAYLQPD